jgi:hypothetical protein
MWWAKVKSGSRWAHFRHWLHGRPDEFIDENGDDLSAW